MNSSQYGCHTRAGRKICLGPRMSAFSVKDHPHSTALWAFRAGKCGPNDATCAMSNSVGEHCVHCSISLASAKQRHSTQWQSGTQRRRSFLSGCWQDVKKTMLICNQSLTTDLVRPHVGRYLVHNSSSGNIKVTHLVELHYQCCGRENPRGKHLSGARRNKAGRGQKDALHMPVCRLDSTRNTTT